ncbi:MAG: ATP-binding protein [Ferruginibacter sp.]|nr:ATP-binding protein [Ferruginibacter sp.]
MVDGILKNSKITDKHNKIEAIELTAFLDRLKDILPSPKPLRFTYVATIDIVYFNRVQLEQVFNNLFSNAIRYNDKEQVEIKVAANEQEGYYNFDVTDNGMGIRAENKASVFELFSTVSEKDNYGLDSSGIGLSIVKKIITAAEGEIKVNSTPGKFTSFSFRLKVPEKS